MTTTRYLAPLTPAEILADAVASDVPGQVKAAAPGDPLRGDPLSSAAVSIVKLIRREPVVRGPWGGVL